MKSFLTVIVVFGVLTSCVTVGYADVSQVGPWITGLTHSPGAGSDRLLVLVAGMENVGERDITSATFGGQPLTRVEDRGVDMSGRNSALEIWYLTEAGIQAAAGNTFQITYDGSPSSFETMYAAATFQGVDQQAPVTGSESESSTSGATITTVPFPVSTGGMSVAGAIQGAAGSFSDTGWGAGWIEGVDFVSGDATLGAAHSISAYTADGTDTATATHTMANNRQVLVAVGLGPAGTAASADLQLTKAVDNDTPQEGDQVTYTVTVTNAGPDQANGIIVRDLLPAGLTYAADTPSQGSYVPGSGNWNVGSLPNAVTATLTLSATVDVGTAGSTITNNSSIVSANPVDPFGSNNTASVGVTVQTGQSGPVSIVSVPFEPGSLLPGGLPVVTLKLNLVNQGTGSDQLQGLTLANATTGPGTIDQLDADWAELSLWVESGGSRFPPPTSDPGAVIAGTFSGGTLTFSDLAVALAPGDTVKIVVMGQAALEARDGDQMAVEITEAQALTFAGAAAVDADWPLESADAQAVNGMVADQLDLRPVAPSPFGLGSIRNLALDVGLPANGYEGDQLDRLNVFNAGNAMFGTDIARLEGWADEGDGVFDPLTDTLLGEFAYTGNRWELTGLSHIVPLTRLRVYVTVDIAESGQAGRTVQLGLPTLPDVGIGMLSGNDGPIDREVVNPFPQSLSTADRVVLSAGIIEPGLVEPGESEVPLLHLVALNTYLDDRQLTGLTVQNRTFGPGSPTVAELDGELDQLKLRIDGDGDGQLGDQVADPVLATGSFSDGEIVFTGLAWDLAAGSINHLFLTGDVSLAGAADGDVLGAEVASGINLEFAAATALATSWPLDSGAAWTVDGMVAAQIGNDPVPAVTLAAGEGPALAMDLTVPSNGYANDTLVGLYFDNLGTATDSDLADLRLWQDGGDGVFSAGSGDDTELGPCTWVTDAWHSPVLAAPLPPGGLRLFVGMTVAAVPTDGATVRLAVPVDGVTVDSDNKGPLDQSVASPVTILLSTAPLLTEVQFQESASTIGQTVTARLRVRNVGNEDLLGVMPHALTSAGDGSLVPVTGPVPASLDLAVGAVDSFTWTYSAASTGGVVLTGSAEGTGAVGGQLRTSLPSASPEHRVFEPASGLDLFAVTNMPFTINRGQTDIVPLSLTFINPSGAGGADGLIRSLRFCLKDDTGTGIVPADLLARVVVNEGGITYLDKTNLETTGNQVTLTLNDPVVVTNHEPVTLSLRLDLRGDTAVPAYLVEITSDTWIEAEDAVSGAAIGVALQDGIFPIQSGLGTLLIEAVNLQVAAVAMAPRQVGSGQRDVTLLAMKLLNPGVSGLGSEIRVGSLAFSLTDTLGVPLAAPSQVLENLRILSPLQTLLDISMTGRDSTTVVLDFDFPLTIPVDTPLDLTLMVDLRDPALPGAVQARLAPVATFDARDGNSGEPVPVIYDADPMVGGTLVVQQVATTMMAQGDPLLPANLVFGARDVSALEFTLRHPGPAEAGAILVESLVVQSRDENRDLVPPASMIDRLAVLHDDVPVGLVSNPTGDGNMVIPLAGIQLQAGQTITLTLSLDLEAAATTGSLELMIPGTGLVAWDANLDLAVIAQPESGADFPLTSGVTRLQDSSDELLVGFTSLMPAVLLDTGQEFPAARVGLRNPDQGGTSGIDLASVTIRASDDRLVVLPVGAAVHEISLWEGDQLWATTGALTLADTVCTLAPGGATFIGPNQTLDLEMLVRFRSPPTVAGLRLGIAANDVQVHQPAGALGNVRVEPEAGHLFPYWTEIGSFTGASLAESYSNFPNPFGAGREATTFVFSLERPATVSLKLLTAYSRTVVSVIENEMRPAGLYQEDTWDGRNGHGTVVQNGVYIAELVAVYADGSEDRQLRKVAVVR